MMVKTCCVYVILDISKHGKYTYGDYSFPYEPIYVGQGKHKRRPLEHYKSYDVKNAKGFFRGIESTFDYISTDLSKEDAIALESEVIKTIGRLNTNTGPLLNRSNGGCSGWGSGIVVDRTYLIGKNNPIHSIDTTGAKNANAKFCYFIVAPDGIEFDVNLGGLPKFCKKHKLPYSTLKCVSTFVGKEVQQGIAKGWFVQKKITTS